MCNKIEELPQNTRIYKTPSGMYLGQISKDGLWETVTQMCFTKWGVRRKLKQMFPV